MGSRLPCGPDGQKDLPHSPQSILPGRPHSQTTIGQYGVRRNNRFQLHDEVFQDAALRGYVDSIHYDGLCTGYKNWVEDMNPVPVWKLAGKLPPLPSLPPPRKSRETYEKGRAVIFLEEMLEKEDSGQNVEKQHGKGSMGREGKGNPPPKATSKKNTVEDLAAGEKAISRPGLGSKLANAKEPVNSQMGGGHVLRSAPTVEEGDDDNLSGAEEKVNDPPCKKCAKNGIPCIVQPEPKKQTGSGKRGVRERLVCLPCQKEKNKCSLARQKGRSPSPDIVEVTRLPLNLKAKEIAPPKPKPMPRKKPQIVPAGGSGEYMIPDDIRRQIEAYECRINELEEQVLDLKENFIRLESEHQSIQAYTNQVLNNVEGVQKLNEHMTKKMNALQMAREDRKGQRMVELMEVEVSSSRPTESVTSNSRKPHPAGSERSTLLGTASPPVRLQEPITTLKPEDEGE